MAVTLTLKELITESDVEQKLLWPLLTNAAPDGLGFSASDIWTKPNLRRLDVGKGPTKRSSFPDYVVLASGLPVLAIEAKVPTEDIDLAFREAREYALAINTLYPPGVNPCQWVIGCNGCLLVLGRWDSETPIVSVSLDEIMSLSESFARFLSKCSRKQLQISIDETLRQSRPEHLHQPTRLLGGKSVRNEELGHNSFGRTIALDYRPIFNPTTYEERSFIVQHAYVPSKRRERFVDPIDKLIRTIRAPSVTHIPTIEDTSAPRELSEILAKPAKDLENQIILLVGSVGSGKTTFVDHLSNVALPEDTQQSVLWARVNLNLAPLDTNKIYDWVCKEVVDSLEKQHSNVDFDEVETIKKVFSVEIRKLEKGILSLLKNDAAQYNSRLADELFRLHGDVVAYTKALSRYLCQERRKLLIIVLDNCDKKDRDHQLLMFQVAHWIQREFRALVFMPIRDVTYDLHRDQPPLDTSLKDLTFRLEPPPFAVVLARRVQLAIDHMSKAGTKKLHYTLQNGIRVEYPASDQGYYLASILKSLYEHERFVRRVISGLAGRDIRRALEIFLEFCSSGHIDEGEILKIRQFEGDYSLPFNKVANVLLRRDRRFYDGDYSFLKNLFQCDPSDAHPDHFTRIAVLCFLSEMLKTPGPSGVAGYHRVEDIVKDLGSAGHDRERVNSELLYLLKAGCIVAEHLRTDDLRAEDLVVLSPAGSIHLTLTSNKEYLAACAEDLWYKNLELAKAIQTRITSRGLSGHFRWNTLRKNALDISRYIASEYREKITNVGRVLENDPQHSKELASIMGAIESGDIGLPSQPRICVRGLPYSLTKDRLLAEVTALGITGVLNVAMPFRSDGQNKGFAFLSFATPTIAGAALEVLDDAVIGGRRVNADEAVSKHTT